jgi:hypothetical protein
MRAIAFTCLLTLAFSACALNAQPSAPWPSDASAPAFPEALGVNIHFTNPDPGEVKMLAAAGFHWVRMDFVWQRTEPEKGKYDFSAYDRLLRALDEYNIRPLFILDYANTLYDDGLAPKSTPGRRAFANWAAAAVSRYRGRGIWWEIYNEPNTGFWTPGPKASDYVALALETSRAIRAVAPAEQIIGPAVWGFDLDFVEACFQAGLLEYWSAVSVHPYRKTEPETVVHDYARLRALITKYAPAGKRVRIISSEWGYSAVSLNTDEGKQAALLVRQLLINQSQGISLSIWYDWQDDGQDPAQIEHRFGTVRPRYYENREPVYDAKPAYQAIKTLTSVLGGFRFSERISGAAVSADDYVLVFRANGETRIAAWTTSWFARAVTIPVSEGMYRVIGDTGEVIGRSDAKQSTLTLNLTNAPQYVVIDRP